MAGVLTGNHAQRSGLCGQGHRRDLRIHDALIPGRGQLVFGRQVDPQPVSYTHLDVYKRQAFVFAEEGIQPRHIHICLLYTSRCV